MPGNPGIAAHARCMDVDVRDHAAVTGFCRDQLIDLVVIGPEAPLVAGLADDLRAAGIAVFGPSAAAAQLEGSKGFTKDLCIAHDVPTAPYVRCTSLVAALAALGQFVPPYVLKADGLAAGKGVVIAATHTEAVATLHDMFDGDAVGAQVVIEAFLDGEEVSFFALTDGTSVAAFGSAQDHKRVGEGDVGPNTGGMGAYSPAAILTPALEAEVMARIITPTIAALAARGTPYSGVLFAGLMLTSRGPELIEYNCRFGDPECQVLMARFEGDLAALLAAVAHGTLGAHPAPSFSRDAALTVVVAARGYPGMPETGGRIDISRVTGARVFQAGTKEQDGHLISAGGRVLAVTALGATVRDAQHNAYAALQAVDFPSGFYRSDIGWREVARQAAAS